MTTDEKDYSDYVKHLSNIFSTCAVFAGFYIHSNYSIGHFASRPKQYHVTVDPLLSNSRVYAIADLCGMEYHTLGLFL